MNLMGPHCLEQVGSMDLLNIFNCIKKIFSYIPNMFKNKSASAFLKENSNILEIKNELLNFTQQNLTTEILAKYVLNKQN